MNPYERRRGCHTLGRCRQLTTTVAFQRKSWTLDARFYGLSRSRPATQHLRVQNTRVRLLKPQAIERKCRKQKNKKTNVFVFFVFVHAMLQFLACKQPKL
jgi:late competence protein required for DNA uptake (superfamily II DNA/RNA helicase)